MYMYYIYYNTYNIYIPLSNQPPSNLGTLSNLGLQSQFDNLTNGTARCSLTLENIK